MLVSKGSLCNHTFNSCLGSGGYDTCLKVNPNCHARAIQKMSEYNIHQIYILQSSQSPIPESIRPKIQCSNPI